MRRTTRHALALVTAAAAALTTAAVPAQASTAAPEPRVVLVSKVGDTTQVFSMRPDGRQRKQLTTLAGNKNDPASSPKGDQVAFMSAYRIYVVPSAGGAARLVTPADDREAYRDPTWLPDGSLLVQRTSGWTGVGSAVTDVEIFRIPAQGSGFGPPQQVTDLAGGSALFPDVTKDGTRLAFSVATTPDAVDMDVHTAALPPPGTVITDGSTTRVTSMSGSEYSPSWSPDGTRIAFWSNGALRGAHVVAAEGGAEPRLLSAYASLGHLDWESTGSTLLADVCVGSYVGVSRIDVATGKRTAVTTGPMDRQPNG